ncbi:MAG TPA: hypothetical protein CFH81_08170 [Sulfurovum sp. UBA12169]|nr:MAG TPA: hypothetical protein CFH81_08170 [Sulfurovum sp. UBA12169]
MVHAGSQLGQKESQGRKEIVSKQFLREIRPLIQPIIAEIYHRLGLDYFGIDCSIDKEMNLLVFEINANMNVFIQTKNSLFAKHIEMIRTALIKMLMKNEK